MTTPNERVWYILIDLREYGRMYPELQLLALRTYNAQAAEMARREGATKGPMRTRRDVYDFDPCLIRLEWVGR